MDNKSLIDVTNIDDGKFFLLSIAKRGYDYFKLLELDADEILDIAEFEEIADAIESVRYEETKGN